MIKISIKKTIRSLYIRYPSLRTLKIILWSLKKKLSIRNILTTSSENKLAFNALTQRRFEYTTSAFQTSNQLINSIHDLIDIDISVVTYNSSKWITQFFDSLKEQKYPLSKINLYFVDNGSSDQTVEILEEYTLRHSDLFHSLHILTQPNLGFGAGHDKAIRLGSCTFCLVSNIDLVFEKNALVNAVKTAMTDITEEYASWEFRQIPYEHPKYYDPVTLETNWSSHACILLRTSAYEKVGGYEPKIFMYTEDVELSYRFRAYGYHLKYCPDAIVRHFTYEEAHQIKPLQFEGSTLGNAYLRLRYGTTIDKLAIIPLFLALWLRKETFPNARKIVSNNIMKIIKNKNYFSNFLSRNQNFHPCFNAFNYDRTRDGAFYPITLPQIFPLVSIIVRTYRGREMLLQQALITIAHQTYTNLEIIIVEDGGSTMEGIAQTMSDVLKIKFFGLEKVGRSATGNFALRHASGEYCIFLDDDDLFFSDHIETLVSCLINDKEASAAYSLAFEIPTHFPTDDKNYYIEGVIYTSHVLYQNFDYSVLEDHNYFPIQTVLFNRNLFLERGGFDETLEYLEDWNLWLRYAYKSKFLYVEKTTSLYRVPALSRTNNDRYTKLYQAYQDAKERAFVSIQELGIT